MTTTQKPVSVAFRGLGLGTLIALLFMPAAASLPGVPGTPLVAGESDHFLGTKDASKAFVIMESGGTDRARDNCVILRPKATALMVADGDIRLAPCLGKPAFSTITSADGVERTWTWVKYDTAGALDTHAVYVDIDNNDKWSKGDLLYFTTKPLVGTEAKEAVVGFSPTGPAGVWTIRITPFQDLPAGSFVTSSDPDFVQYGRSAKLPQGYADRKGALVEREDKQWFWVSAATVGGVAKNVLVPAEALRVSKIDPFMPDVRVTGISVATEQILTGQPFNVVVEVKNNGKIGGVGLVISRFDDLMVDAKLTPLLSAGETAKMIVALTAPKDPGTVALKVNELFQVIEVTGDAAAEVSEVGTLTEKLTALEARLGELETASQETAIQVAQVSSKPEGASPGVDGLVFLAGLVAGLAVLRRRRA